MATMLQGLEKLMIYSLAMLQDNQMDFLATKLQYRLSLSKYYQWLHHVRFSKTLNFFALGSVF